MLETFKEGEKSIPRLFLWRIFFLEITSAEYENAIIWFAVEMFFLLRSKINHQKLSKLTFNLWIQIISKIYDPLERQFQFSMPLQDFNVYLAENAFTQYAFHSNNIIYW